jgi:hypothetical protein
MIITPFISLMTAWRTRACYIIGRSTTGKTDDQHQCTDDKFCFHIITFVHTINAKGKVPESIAGVTSFWNNVWLKKF